MSTPDKNSSREQARKIAKSQIKADKRSGAFARWGIVGLAAVLILAIAFFIWFTNRPAGPAKGPANFSSSGGILFNSDKNVTKTSATTVKPDTKHALGSKGTNGKVKLTMYVDFMCPACGAFEKANSATIKSLLDQGKVEVEYHPIAILDRMSNGTNYSTRALNAVACVANQSPENAYSMISVLYANQPEENSDGLDDNKLASLGKQASGKDISKCVKNQTYKSWTKVVSQNSIDSGISGTPTIYINDKQWDGKTPLAKAVAEAK
ncbi:MAG: DsbA family protein [Micrococcaceae bacterium]